MVSQLETLNLSDRQSIPPVAEGLVQVFTSAHRNFFTSVMAQALNIAGHGTPVLIAQFLKGGINQGCDRPMRLGQTLDWVRCDLPRCIDTAEVDPEEVASLNQLWHYTETTVNQGKYDLVVLDELSLAVNFGFISEDDVLKFLQARPPHVDVILTGPDMPQAILDAADQITELRRSHH